MVAEVARSGIHWMEPRDLPIGDAHYARLTSTSAGLAIRGGHFDGIVAYTAVSARPGLWTVNETTTQKELKVMLTGEAR